MILELSEEDLALIHALQIAPRVSWADAAEILGVHATTLAARWERLRAGGASWITAHLIGDPKQMCLAFVAVDCEMNRRDDVTARLAAMPEIVTVEEAASNRDLMLTVITGSLEEFSTNVVSRLKDIDGLLKYQTSLCTRLHAGGDSWRLNVLSRAQQASFRGLARPGAADPERPDAVQPPLPATHLALLPFLAKDGRATAADIARALGRNPATVQRQLNRVLASGILSLRCEIAQKILVLSCDLPVVRQRPGRPARGRGGRHPDHPERAAQRLDHGSHELRDHHVAPVPGRRHGCRTCPAAEGPRH